MSQIIINHNKDITEQEAVYAVKAFIDLNRITPAEEKRRIGNNDVSMTAINEDDGGYSVFYDIGGGNEQGI